MAATPRTQTPSEYPKEPNPFFTAETGDREGLARWMLEQPEDEPEAARSGALAFGAS